MTRKRPPTARDALLGLTGTWVPWHVGLAQEARSRCGTGTQRLVLTVLLEEWSRQQGERPDDELGPRVVVSLRALVRALHGDEERTPGWWDGQRRSLRRVVAQLVDRGLLLETDARGRRGERVLDITPLLDLARAAAKPPDPTVDEPPDGRHTASGGTQPPEAENLRGGRHTASCPGGTQPPCPGGTQPPVTLLESKSSAFQAEQSSYEQEPPGGAAAPGAPPPGGMTGQERFRLSAGLVEIGTDPAASSRRREAVSTALQAMAAAEPGWEELPIVVEVREGLRPLAEREAVPT